MMSHETYQALPRRSSSLALRLSHEMRVSVAISISSGRQIELHEMGASNKHPVMPRRRKCRNPHKARAGYLPHTGTGRLVEAYHEIDQRLRSGLMRCLNLSRSRNLVKTTTSPGATKRATFPRSRLPSLRPARAAEGKGAAGRHAQPPGATRSHEASMARMASTALAPSVERAR